MSQEISRDALLIYLNNVRMLETMIAESRKKIPQLTRQKDNQDNRLTALGKEPWVPNKPSLPDKPKFDYSFGQAVSVFGYSLLICILCIGSALVVSWGFLKVIGWIGAIGFFCWWISLSSTIGIIGAVKDYLREKQKYAEESADFPRRMEIYNEEKQKYDSELQEYRYRKQEIERKIADNKFQIGVLQEHIKADIQTLENDLQEAYNANIIPMQFRNIEGVYYLYDYLSTSNESLTSALMQANLEAIKQKLDNMIALQGAMIIQQAQANQILFEQNRQILETAQGIENNTFVAAQYAKISAVNSAVSLRLQEQQLAYQKADFWLHIND